MVEQEKFAIVSGGFDPIHNGHVRMIQDAAKYGRVIVILNNDKWLMTKKGFVFMDQKTRKEIVENIKNVDRVIITNHKKNDKDTSVCKVLNDLHYTFSTNLIFCNGGDRKADNIPEYELCKLKNIPMVFNIGGRKINSSSDLVRKAKVK